MLFAMFFATSSAEQPFANMQEYRQAKRALYNKYKQDLHALKQRRPKNSNVQKNDDSQVATSREYMYVIQLPAGARIQQDQIHLSTTRRNVNLSVHGEKHVQRSNGNFASESFSESRSFSVPADALVSKAFTQISDNKIVIHVPRK